MKAIINLLRAHGENVTLESGKYYLGSICIDRWSLTDAFLYLGYDEFQTAEHLNYMTA